MEVDSTAAAGAGGEAEGDVDAAELEAALAMSMEVEDAGVLLCSCRAGSARGVVSVGGRGYSHNLVCRVQRRERARRIVDGSGMQLLAIHEAP